MKCTSTQFLNIICFFSFFFLLPIKTVGFTIQESSNKCEKIIDELVRLEKKLSDSNPNSYFDLGIKLLNLRGSSCINNEQKDSFSSYFNKGAKLGSGKAAMYLGREYYLGRYFPINDQLAYDLFIIGYIQSKNKTNERVNAWISAVNLLSLSGSSKIKKNTDESIKHLISKNYLAKYILENYPFKNTKAKKSSEKEAVAKYNRLMKNIYLKGLYQIPKNPSKAVIMAFEYSGASGYENYYKEIIQNNQPKGIFKNKALQLLMAAKCLENIYCKKYEGVREYAMKYLNENIGNFKDLNAFNTLYTKAPLSIRKLLDKAYYNPSLEKKWKTINKVEFKYAKADPKWKYLPVKKQLELKNEAKKEKKSSLNGRERLIIFLSMVQHGDYEGYYYLGNAYRYRWGVPGTDIKKAMKYYHLAIEKSNYKKAYEKLAQIYDKGYQIKPHMIDLDWKLAAKYYKLAGDKNPIALRKLGEMQLFGVGGFTQDIEKAKQKFKAADKIGDKQSALYLEVLDYATSQNFSDEFNVRTFNLKIDKSIVAKPIVFKAGKSFTLPITYNVKGNDTYKYIRLFPSKTQKYAISYYNYSGSPKIKGEGVFDLFVNYGRDDSRQIGLFYVTFTANDITSNAFVLPLAICWVNDQNK